MNKQVFILGAGGHAKVVIDALLEASIMVAGCIEPDLSNVGAEISRGIRVAGDEGVLLKLGPEQVYLVNGVGSIGTTDLRRRIFDRFKAAGFEFLQVLHPKAIISKEVTILEGSQIMAGAILQSGVFVGANTIVNSGSVVDHDCRIGDHCHVAPGATLSGRVLVGSNTHIGTGSSVIQDVRIGHNCLVGAGAVVTKDISDSLIARGVPARTFNREVAE